MKTIVFHSYKGGVGRTLALANFAVVLNLIDKNVLILDWDFDAPGVPIKYELEDKVKKGYIDYLFSIRKQYDTDIQYSDLGYRKKYLKSCIINYEGTNIYLLPAGDRSNKNYWLNLSSLHCQRFFIYSNLEEKEKNEIFFKEDIELLKNCIDNKEIDYLLIDCKTANSNAAIPLMLLGDKVVELFNCNNEGVFGELLVRSAIRNLNIKDSRGVKLISVMTRVPSEFTAPHARREYKKIASNLLIHEFLDLKENDLAEILFIIHECRVLEIVESLILDKENKNILLSHDYIDLFKEILKDDPRFKEQISSLGSVDFIKRAIGLAEEVELIERFFSLEVLRGILYNNDNERNVAIRCDTLKDMLNGLGKDMQDHLRNAGMDDQTINANIAKSFEDAGYRAGEGFGIESITPGKVWDIIPQKSSDRLTDWLQFDSAAGFGNWTHQLDEVGKTCIITLNNHFLSETDYGAFFLFGYIRGVLSYLIPGKDDPVTVLFKSYENNEVTLAYD
jgi:MinD-like ATPase involved in chromosome partitioning or flagellar assembly